MQDIRLIGSRQHPNNSSSTKIAPDHMQHEGLERPHSPPYQCHRWGGTYRHLINWHTSVTCTSKSPHANILAQMLLALQACDVK